MAKSVAKAKKNTWWGFPKQIAYIVGNEACERFSFYGMRSILVVFMTHHLLLPEHRSKATYHFFLMAVYFLPLFGGFLSDRYLGKYRTILYLSIVYCLGHGVLAMFETEAGLYAGLALIAIGSGGIKPCVSSFVGDQFDKSNQHLVSKVYALFYLSINFGSLFSTILIPWVLPNYGPSVAFGIPGVFMAIATVFFVLGHRHYVMVPPAGKEGSAKFFAILWHGLTHKAKGGISTWLDSAKTKYGADRVEGVKAVFGVATIFSTVTVFWALWDQQGSSWILQAEKMNQVFLGVPLLPSQMQTANPIFVMLCIPLLSYGLYPFIEKFGFTMTPLRRMGLGMFLTGVSFAMVGIIQVVIDSGTPLNIAWQFLPFFVISASEVMVSVTGLEFAYTQAPKSMKGMIMSLYLLAISLGNLLTATISGLNPFTSAANEFFFYGGLVFVLSFGFVAIAMNYKMRNFVAST